MPQDPLSPEAKAQDPRIRAAVDRYWRRNVRVMIGLLCVWALVGLGAGVLFADYLNDFDLGGFRLGFWFAQQGSIIVFVLLILIYAVVLNRLDAEHHAEVDRIRQGRPQDESAS